MSIENALESGLNNKKVCWIKNVEADQMTEVVLRGFHRWNKHCTMIIKRHRIKGKQAKVGGFIVEESSLLKNFIQMKILKLLINCFQDLPTVSKFHFPRKTHCAQKDPQSLSYSIAKFHSKLSRAQRREKHQIKDIANMDQMPLSFMKDDGKTYTDKGSSEVWCATHDSSLDKRQCSVQLTIFADGRDHDWNLLLFFGSKVWESKVRNKMHGIDVWKFCFKKRLGVTNQEC